MAEDEIGVGRKRYAVLVDADNVSSELLSPVVAEVSKYGVATVRRAYGNWRSENLKNWSETLHSQAFIPVHHTSSVTGKNSTDVVLVIDAMDLLYSGNVDGFCLVSNDSDFTRLVLRLREHGKPVIVVGREDAPKDLKGACDVFVSTRILLPTRESPAAKARAGGRGGRAPERDRDVEPVPLDMLFHAYDSVVAEDGWAHLGTLGNYLRRMDPSFDPRTFGYSTLSKLFQALGDRFEYELFERENGQRDAYVRSLDDVPPPPSKHGRGGRRERDDR